MKALLVICMVLGIVSAVVGVNFVCKTKALWNFECVVECAIGRNALLSYNGYGCYCGFGGCGTPVDGIDECCKHHDACYNAAMANSSCSEVTEYTAIYHWSCKKDKGASVGTPVCNDDLNKKENRVCGEALCKCDSAAALCFAKQQYPAKKPKCDHWCPWFL